MNQARKASSSPSSPARPGGLEVDGLRRSGSTPRRRHHHGAVPPQGPRRKGLPPSCTPFGNRARCHWKIRSRVRGSRQPSTASARIPTTGSTRRVSASTRLKVAWRPSRSSIDARTASRSRDTPSMALLLTTSRAMAASAASPATVHSTAFTTPRSSDWARRARSRGAARAPESQVNPPGHPGNSQMKVSRGGGASHLFLQRGVSSPKTPQISPILGHFLRRFQSKNASHSPNRE